MSDKTEPPLDAPKEISKPQTSQNDAITKHEEQDTHRKAFQIAHQNDHRPSDARLIAAKPGETTEEYAARVKEITSNQFALVGEILPEDRGSGTTGSKLASKAIGEQHNNVTHAAESKPLPKLQYQTPKMDTSSTAVETEQSKKFQSIIDYTAPPSDAPRRVKLKGENREPALSINGFIPEHNEYLNFIIQTYPEVAPDEVETIKTAIRRIPEAERKLLNASGVSFVLTNNVSDARPELEDETTRVAGQKFDGTPGFFEHNSHQIVLALRSVHESNNIDSGAVKIISGNKHSLKDTFGHEVGHALDKVLRFSENEEFIDACNEDTLKLIRSDWDSFEKLSYYLKPELSQSGQTDWDKQRVGRQEMFAQMYSALRTSPDDLREDGKLLKEKFPNVFKVIEKMLRNLDEEQA